MIYECLMCVILTLLVKQVELYQGDECFGESGPGTCKRLSHCPHLLNEIRRAGVPMPEYLRRRLHQLACGFEYDQPLICCEAVYTNVDHGPSHLYEYTAPSTHDFRPTHHWLGSNEDDRGPNTNEYRPQTNGPTRPQRPITDHRDDSLYTNNDISNHRNLRLLPSNCGPIENDRIYGGERTRLFEMPWMVLLSYDSARGTKLSCGGSLVTERVVLTAAHCVSFLGAKLKLRSVVVGEYDTRTDPDCERNDGELTCAPGVQNVPIASVLPHSGYSPQKLVDDIALIKLARPVDFSLESVKPICLPINAKLRDESLDGLQGVVAGWGATEDGLQSPVLLSVEMPILSNDECRDIYNGSAEISNSQLCAGGVSGKDSCGGDSGGPLLYPGRAGGAGARYVQRGIVSFGAKRCGLGGFPGVYTRVASYMDWILDNLS